MATYYVSFLNGDDTRTALQAQNKATPWKHHPDSNLATGNSSAIKGSLAAGDVIVMSRGESWHGTKFTTNKAGTSGNQIITKSDDTFGVDDALPLISAATVVTGWTDTGTNGEFKAALATQTYVVFWGDTELTAGTVGSLPSNGFGWSANELYVKIGGNPTGEQIFAATAYPLWMVHSYRTFDGLEFMYSNDTTAGVVYTGNALSGLALLNSKFSRARQNIIRFLGSVAPLVDGCTITARDLVGVGSGYGVLAGNGTASAIIRNSVINSKNSAAMSIANTNEVYGNVISGKYDGIVIAGNQNTIYRNTLSLWNGLEYGAGGNGNDVFLSSTAQDNVIKHNLFKNGYVNVTTRETSGNGNNKIQANVFERPRVNGIQLGCSGVTLPDTVERNIFIHRPTAGNPSGSVGHAVVVGSAELRTTECSKAKILGNLFIGETSGAEMISFDAGLNIYPAGMAALEIDYNCYWQRNAGAAWRNPNGLTNITDFAAWKTALSSVGVTGADAHSVHISSSGVSPVVAIDGENYRPVPTSPCIGAGVDVGLTTDADGNAVPGAVGYDIGPYSYMPGWTVFDGTMPPLSLASTCPGSLLEVQEWKKANVTKRQIDSV
jgi:hypothetical protein